LTLEEIMADEQILKKCALPLWRILIEDKYIDGGFGHRLYWEWCDSAGNSCNGEEVEGGNWQLFADMFNGIGTQPTLRIGQIYHDDELEKLRQRIE